MVAELAKESVALAVIDPTQGEVVDLPDIARPAPLPLDEAERLFGLIAMYEQRIKKLKELVRIAVEFGWAQKGQREGILGGERYVVEAKPGTWTYDEQGLYEALMPFVGKVFTEDELIAAVGRLVVPSQIIPAQVVPERVLFGANTAKVDALGRKSEEVAAVISRFRSRDEGVPTLTKARR